MRTNLIVAVAALLLATAAGASPGANGGSGSQGYRGRVGGAPGLGAGAREGDGHAVTTTERGGRSVATIGPRGGSAARAVAVRPRATTVARKPQLRSPKRPAIDTGYARVYPCPDFQTSSAALASLCYPTTKTALPKN